MSRTVTLLWDDEREGKISRQQYFTEVPTGNIFVVEEFLRNPGHQLLDVNLKMVYEMAAVPHAIIPNYRKSTPIDIAKWKKGNE